MPPVLSVIIPAFNKWELTSACLRSLREHTSCQDYEVLVMDNASTDATASELPDLGTALFGSSFKTVRFEQNRNFGPACNAGAALASSPVLFFLNNDTILTPGWDEPLLCTLRLEDKLAGVGPLLLYENDRVQHLGVVFDLVGPRHLYADFPRSHPVVSKRRHFQVLTGAALMIHTRLFQARGGFHEEYVNGFEDIDLCLRISATGRKFACVPDSIIYHLEGQSLGRKAQEAHNAALCSKRCSHLRRFDMHNHLLEDGFEVFLKDTLSLGFRLPEQTSRTLVRAHSGKSLPEWFKVVQENPAWVEGRQQLIQALEQTGSTENTLTLYTELCDILGQAAMWKQLQNRAIMQGNKELEQKSLSLWSICTNRREDKARIKSLLNKARKDGDPFLEKLLEDTIRDRFA